MPRIGDASALERSDGPVALGRLVNCCASIASAERFCIVQRPFPEVHQKAEVKVPAR